jgi:excisionase family DNA binding protein
MPDKLPDLYSIKEVAAFLKVTERTVRRWIHEGLITAYRFGRQWRITHSDFQAFAEGHRRERRFDVR